MKQNTAETPEDTYARTRDAVEFLYEEAIRNKSYDMAEILLQALACCEQLMDDKYRPAVKSPDAVNCLRFIKEFMDMDDAKKKRMAELLADLN
jgi:hypothetical protein